MSDKAVKAFACFIIFVLLFSYFDLGGIYLCSFFWGFVVRRQRTGVDLEGLDIKELRGLEQNIDEALKLVRNRKVRY